MPSWDDVELIIDGPPSLMTVAAPATGLTVCYGYSIKESTGSAPAELDIYDGTDTTSTFYIPVTLLDGQSTSDWWGPEGILFRIGVFPHVATGSVVGVFYIATAHWRR